MKSKIINILLILFPIIIIELLSQIIFLSYGVQKYSILLKPFANVIQKTIKKILQIIIQSNGIFHATK